ncbi:acyltransferase family protein [Actinoplanes sp. CA-015351]|uniref:acyltransferase family protein n=1 Tax=Actinoplanes sp. CA-015351 TaxID=3239897 RepID=UPI003D965F3A
MRNRYLDLLRAVAIVRVIVYHHFGWPLLSILFPAMGIMFAVAGSLTAASLAKRSPGNVVVSRMRRLLPPVWLLGLIAVPVMLYTGWRGETDGEHPFSPLNLAFWVLPLGDPPGSDSGAFVWDALWYVRTYLWLVLLSPLLYPVFRKVGWPLLAVPLLLMVFLEHGSFGMPAPVESALWDLSTYGACWLAGFAHRDGRLGRTNPVLVVISFAALAGLGIHWLVQNHAETGWDLNEVSEAQAVYSLAFVLIALRWQPPIEKLVATPSVSKAISLLNARAVTVYLWHGVAIASVWPILEFAGMEDLGDFEPPVTLGITFVVTALAVVLFGWAEDLAAQRRPRLWPADEAGRGGGSGSGSGSGLSSAPVGPGSVGSVGSVPSGWPEVPREEAAIARAGTDQLPTPGLSMSAAEGPRVTSTDTTQMSAPGLSWGGAGAGAGPRYIAGRDGMPVAGRPSPGYAIEGADHAVPEEGGHGGVPDGYGGVPDGYGGASEGYGGVPWVGHAGSAREPGQPGSQRGAREPDDAPALRYDGTP